MSKIYVNNYKKCQNIGQKMSFRSRMLSVLDVVLRVPPIFIMDSILINGLGEMTPISYINHNINNNVNYNRINSSNNWKVSITSMNGSHSSVEEEEDDIISLSLTTSSIVWIIVYIHGIYDLVIICIKSFIKS